MGAIAEHIAGQTPQVSEATPSPGPWRFVGWVLLVLAGVVVTTLAVTFVVPDGNDYARASVLKHQRLAALPSPKIVLVGGSNLAYGIDSAVVEQETKCQVVNMGMNGHLGARFMLDEVTPHLKKSDIVVVSLEYQNFFNPVDGSGTDQLMLAKTNPQVWSTMTPQQKLRAIAAVPMVAQQKLLRLIRSGVTWGDISANDFSDRIETFAAFDKYGDLTSHLNLEWPHDDTDRFDLSRWTMDTGIVPLLQSFTVRMNERGIRTIYSYSPLKRDFYETHEKAIANIHARMTGAAPIVTPQPPSTFVYDNGLFFDSIYHLNAKGRAPRSKQLAADIRNTLLGGGDCTTGSLADRDAKTQ